MGKLDSTETLAAGKKSTETGFNTSAKTIKQFRNHSDYVPTAALIMEDNLIACGLDSDGKITSLAGNEGVFDSNLYGAVLATSHTQLDLAVILPLYGTVQTSGEMWFRYDSDTDAPTISTFVGLSNSVKGKVRKYPPIADEVFTDSEAAGAMTHWIRYNRVLEVDSDNYRVKVWIP